MHIFVLIYLLLMSASFEFVSPMTCKVENVLKQCPLVAAAMVGSPGLQWYIKLVVESGSEKVKWVERTRGISQIGEPNYTNLTYQHDVENQ